jgi:hypothetical protein
MSIGDLINSLSDIRQTLSLCRGSHSGSQSHVTLDDSSGQMNPISSRGSIRRIEIPSPVEIISWSNLSSCSSLTAANPFVELQFIHLLKSSRQADFPCGARLYHKIFAINETGGSMPRPDANFRDRSFAAILAPLFRSTQTQILLPMEESEP